MSIQQQACRASARTYRLGRELPRALHEGADEHVVPAEGAADEEGGVDAVPVFFCWMGGFMGCLRGCWGWGDGGGMGGVDRLGGGGGWPFTGLYPKSISRPATHPPNHKRERGGGGAHVERPYLLGDGGAD